MGGVEGVASYLESIEEGKEVNAFLDLNPRALEEARLAEGKLAGLAIAVKSNISVKGLRAACASFTLENYVAGYDATVVERIRKEGGVVVGMTNMDEFACGSSGETSAFGPTQNPAAPGRIPGGSSSGSAAAVAASLCDAALGSDTGGSIRNPASHCGIVGIKPTYGLVPRYGLIDLAMSLDQIGPMARDVHTAALLLEVIAGPNPKECTTLKVEPPEYSRLLSRKIDGCRIGYAREFEEFTDPRITSVIKKSLDRLERMGAEVVPVTLPNLGKGLSTYYLTVFVEFFSATRKFDGRRYGRKIEEVCGREVLRRILLGRYISQKEYSGKYYKKALQFRSLIKRELLGALEGVDVIAGPTVPKLPHRLGESMDPMAMYGYDVLTVPTNLAGIPAGVIKAGEVDGIPVGLQVQGEPLGEQKILNVLYALEDGGC
ncbi:MAG: Asp-tRNA(Asn)/Glu-tRNA(Gln) amidotransferase subunit GatA [Euryarchaeota archaeon]|nr:Asp-tRNA(Asn)/Glu-tRNA(Gln) amidotransferase subunit GatA [Euryarchaeota archaeon]